MAIILVALMLVVHKVQLSMRGIFSAVLLMIQSGVLVFIFWMQCHLYSCMLNGNLSIET